MDKGGYEQVQGTTRKESIGEKVVAVIIGLAVIVILIILETYPHYPTSFIGWLLYVAIGIPAYIFFEWLGGKIFSKKLGYKLSAKTFSAIRIVFALVVVLFLYGAVALVIYLISTRHAPIF